MRAAQIDVAILQARVFADVHGFFHRERRRPRFVQDPTRSAWISTSPVGMVGLMVSGVRSSTRPSMATTYSDRSLLRAVMDVGIQTFVEDDLRHTVAIAQVNEDDLSEVAAAMHPSHDDGALTGIFAAQLAAGVRATKVAKEVELQGLFWFRHL